MNASKRSRGICVYCCEREATTKDHVIARCIFHGNMPSDMATVPACVPCNVAKSRDDDFLREILAIDPDNTNHPVAQAVFRNMMSAHRKNMSQLGRDIVSKGRLMPVYSKGGVYLRHQHGVPLDTVRMNRIFERITRGLYYKMHRVRLPKTCEFDVKRVENFRVARCIGDFHAIGIRKCKLLANVFGCMTGRAIEDPTVTVWLQRYYNVFIRVTTNMPDVESLNPTDDQLLLLETLETQRAARSHSPEPLEILVATSER